MASTLPKAVTVDVAVDTEALVRHLTIVRTLISQIGFAFDTAIMALQETALIDGDGCG